VTSCQKLISKGTTFLNTHTILKYNLIFLHITEIIICKFAAFMAKVQFYNCFFYLCNLFKKINTNNIMNIALIGYGRMGQEIEQIAKDRGHNVKLIIDIDNEADLNADKLNDIDVAIEFTIPSSAIGNYKTCFDSGVPVVSGTTGWLDNWDEIEEYCINKGAAFFYASNFSLGVNLFFDINRKLARLMKSFDQYKTEMTEVHHTRKLDSPSGTAISLAEDIMDENKDLKKWENNKSNSKDTLGIVSLREGDVPGIHTIRYDSEIDYIEITHSAKTRKGFAFGAVLAAEYAAGKKGILTMKEMLNIED
jgi:4-hydroxy-tetrahydrodipicolinate reductase